MIVKYVKGNTGRRSLLTSPVYLFIDRKVLCIRAGFMHKLLKPEVNCYGILALKAKLSNA
jgi:hypothetical protein